MMKESHFIVSRVKKISTNVRMYVCMCMQLCSHNKLDGRKAKVTDQNLHIWVKGLT